jgi:hypothetical protein
MKFKFKCGEEVELYSIGVLAEKLGRTPEAIRQWEQAGVLPPALFKDKNKYRLYSAEQIDAIIKCAEECGIGQGKSLFGSDFPKRVWCELGKIKDKYERMSKRNGT